MPAWLRTTSGPKRQVGRSDLKHIDWLGHSRKHDKHFGAQDFAPPSLWGLLRGAVSHARHRLLTLGEALGYVVVVPQDRVWAHQDDLAVQALVIEINGRRLGFRRSNETAMPYQKYMSS